MSYCRIHSDFHSPIIKNNINYCIKFLEYTKYQSAHSQISTGNYLYEKTYHVAGLVFLILEELPWLILLTPLSSALVNKKYHMPKVT